jgi:hypothetical protein
MCLPCCNRSFEELKLVGVTDRWRMRRRWRRKMLSCFRLFRNTELMHCTGKQMFWGRKEEGRGAIALCLHAYMCVYLCVCVCLWDRERNVLVSHAGLQSLNNSLKQQHK